MSPTVYARQEALAKAKLAESLQERIQARPGPLDLVRSNVMEVPRPLKYLVQDDRPTSNFSTLMRKRDNSTSSLDPNAPTPPPLPEEETVAGSHHSGGMHESPQTSRQLSRASSHDDPSGMHRKPRSSMENIATISESADPPPRRASDILLLEEGPVQPKGSMRTDSPPLIAVGLGKATPQVPASTQPLHPVPLPDLPQPPKFRSFSEAKQLIIVNPPPAPAVATSVSLPRPPNVDVSGKIRSTSFGEGNQVWPVVFKS